MACETYVRQGQTLAQRMEEARVAVKKLETELAQGRVRVVIAPNGALAFQGWTKEDRRDITDACAYRTLTAASSWTLKQAIARAESQQGRKVNPNAVMAGHHSHDGGRTWQKH